MAGSRNSPEELPAFDEESGDLNVIIETPKGSRIKYAYDPKAGFFSLRAVLPEGTSFPYDFGFVPSTLAEDGDPLDVLVLMDMPIVLGCLLTARPIGVIEVEQTEDGETVRNDRLLAVATRAHTHEDLHSLDDLRPRFLEEIEAFFDHYTALAGKKFQPIGRAGPEEALKLVRAAMRKWKRGRKRR